MIIFDHNARLTYKYLSTWRHDLLKLVVLTPNSCCKYVQNCWLKSSSSSSKHTSFWPCPCAYMCRVCGRFPVVVCGINNMDMKSREWRANKSHSREREACHTMRFRLRATTTLRSLFSILQGSLLRTFSSPSQFEYRCHPLIYNSTRLLIALIMIASMIL